MPTTLLAFVSGIPALVYQVVWTREVALLAGSQIEAISLVLAAFFGGLALGSRWLGPAADRAAAPLRVYAVLELAAAALAALSLPLLRVTGELAQAADADRALPWLAAALLLPVTFLLGGTLPALLCADGRELAEAPRRAGRIVAANTAGSVLGVVLASAWLPWLGQRATQGLAALLAASLALVALGLARGVPPAAASPAGVAPRLARPALAAAFAAGAVTLAFEVITTRLAALRLGSSLYAWAVVLALFLLGLAGGNAALAGRAARTPRPARDLGVVQAFGALAMALAVAVLVTPLAQPAQGLTADTLLRVLVGVLPAAFAMGAAFPLFVRLAAGQPPLGAAFGRVSAVNTAGGIVGSLAAAFVGLPSAGPAAAGLVCAGSGALLATAFLWLGSAGPRRALAPAAAAAAALLAISAGGLAARSTYTGIAAAAHGRQATAAVAIDGARRDLFVDGDAEASTRGDARRTEELLALVPLLLHPDPRSLFEVGFGAGITLGTAARLPLAEIGCAEIADSVLALAPFFEPDNRGVARSSDPRVRIERADGRALLRRRRGAYDVVIANTVQPWSVGATGLYSREYFTRMADALRPGGLAVQWLPAERIGAESLEAILRTFFAVFPEGGILWGAQNILAVGALAPLAPIGAARFAAVNEHVADLLAANRLREPADLAWLAQASAVREALGPGMILSDDRPLLEALAAPGRARPPGGELALLARLAAAGAHAGGGSRALALWLEAGAERAAGDEPAALRLEERAEAEGLALARDSRVLRALATASGQLAAGRSAEATLGFEQVLATGLLAAPALRGLAHVAFQAGRDAEARAALERSLAIEPSEPEAWNLLGAVLRRQGEARGASRAFERALALEPWYPEALGNSGLTAVQLGDEPGARRALSRLEVVGRERAETKALAAALQDRTSTAQSR